jgi:hypothetical protein
VGERNKEIKLWRNAGDGGNLYGEEILGIYFLKL